jgi:hypothetical protein
VVLESSNSGSLVDFAAGLKEVFVAYPAERAVVTSATPTNGDILVFSSGLYAPQALPSSIPSGTVMLFVQTTAPVGFTKSTANNDKALRVVSGTASTGGSVAFTTAFASQAVNGSIANTTATNISATATNQSATATNIAATQGGTVGSTTLSVAQMPSHGHNTTMNNSYGGVVESDSSFAWARADANLAAGSTFTTQSAGSSNSHNHTFSGDSHNHTQNSHNHTQDAHNHTQNAHNHTFTGTAIDMAVQYVDVIIATKD